MICPPSKLYPRHKALTTSALFGSGMANAPASGRRFLRTEYLCPLIRAWSPGAYAICWLLRNSTHVDALSPLLETDRR
jgi:hypothetical protein